MVKKKGQSKRCTLHKKYKIEKKVREHKRQLRKKEKTHGKKNKNPGIPNSWPFKEELLTQIENDRLSEIANSEEMKEKKKKEKKIAKMHAMEALAMETEITPLSVQAKRKKDVQDAIETSDLILFVLDARDPIGSRSLTFEDGIIGKASKKIALVLNKVDMVDSDLAQKVDRNNKTFRMLDLIFVCSGLNI